MNLLTSPILCEVPSSPARGGWSVDPFRLEEAITELQLRFLVRIRYTDGFYKLGGHTMKRKRHSDHLWHRIVLSQDRSKEQANEILWHELRHAYQQVRYAEDLARQIDGNDLTSLFVSFYREEYKKARGRHGASYRENRYEIDARRFATGMKGRYLLR